MRFCSACGDQVVLKVPVGDNRLRHVCKSCGTVHYANPRLVVGCLVTYGDRVLLCRRAIEPRRRFWTIPAGFMENGETTVEGAIRETWEEAHASVDAPDLYRIVEAPDINEVYMIYRCKLRDGRFGTGPESLETALFAANELPWKHIAFPAVKNLLKAYFDDLEIGRFPLHVYSNMVATNMRSAC